MTFTRRGKWTAVASAVLVLAVAAALIVAITGKGPAFIQQAVVKVGLADPPPPPTCPLTGEPAPHGVIPHRPVLAVKVENLPEARPQAGLQAADIVYEEPVEGGITRFIVLFQCHDADRVGPVRSGRTTDPGILVQYGKSLLAYAGGANEVVRAIDRAGLIDVNYVAAAKAYVRDPNRLPPHNLYASTKKLYAAGKSKEGTPSPAFTYDPDVPDKSRRGGEVHLDFSSYSDVYWRWDRRDGVWYRSHGDVPHTIEDGDQVSAANVVVQVVDVQPGSIIDAAGNPSPEVRLTGSGKAYVFRDGRMIVGKWIRDTIDDVTEFVRRAGQEIPLAPGRTWIELLPASIRVQVA